MTVLFIRKNDQEEIAANVIFILELNNLELVNQYCHCCSAFQSNSKVNNIFYLFIQGDENQFVSNPAISRSGVDYCNIESEQSSKRLRQEAS